jgi:hypothetical protein
MRTRTPVGIALAVAVAAVCLGLSGAAPPAAKSAKDCPNPQSPRVLDHYDQHPTFSVDRVPGSSDSVWYTRLSDHHRFLLKRCGQHYHCQAENVQLACGQHGATGQCGNPAPGAWVEVHTLYSTKVDPGPNCDPEGVPGCCLQENPGGDPPPLVIGYHAKVTAKGPPLQPVPVPWGHESARWSGSTTGINPPEVCKDPAQWLFILGCDFTVTEEQLGLFHHIDQSRGLQQQLSHDLTHDPPR